MGVLDKFLKKIDIEDVIGTNGLIIDKHIKINNSGDFIYRYIVNGVLIFMATYGSLTCFASAFSIEYYKVILFFVLLVISMLYAFMHISKKIRKIGYGVVFATYIYLIVRLHVVIKSGFAKIVNTFMEYVETFFVLPMTKRYSEYVEDSRMAVTVCMILVGFVMALLLNIIISEFMSIIGLIIVTLPIAQVGMYFDLQIDYLSVLFLFTSFIGVFGIKMSRRYCISENEVTYSTNSKGGQNYVRYGTDPKVMTQFAVVVMGAVLMGILCVSPFVYISNYGHNSKIKAIKRSTNVYVRDFTITGIAGLLFGNSYGAGGISGGEKLGQASVIWRDYKTDLEVTFVPLNMNRKYLRAFVGSNYSDSQWRTLEISEESKYYDILSQYDKFNFTSSILKADFDAGIGAAQYKGNMKITNVGADRKYVFSPYYSLSNIDYSSVFNDDTIFMHTDLSSYKVEYYPYINNTYVDFMSSGYYTKLMQNNEKYDYSKEVELFTYSWFVRDSYLNIPDDNYDVVEKICDDNNIDAINIEENDTQKRYEDIQSTINKVVSLMDNNYEYSLKCGKTPNNTDFVNYFLDGNKSGYCTHFASAATLLFRYLGIPARYVEGYVIDREDIIDGEVVDEPVEDYLVSGNSADIDTDSLKVYKTYINDSSAHAWVEVYFDDFGWVPVEVTPSNDEDGNSGFESNGFLNSILSLFSSDSSKKVESDSNKSGTTVSDFYAIGKNILLVCAAIMVLAVVGWGVKLFIVYYNRKKKINSNDYSYGINILYEYLSAVFKVCGFAKEKSATTIEYYDKIANELSVDKDTLKKIYKYYAVVNYSIHEIDSKQYDYVKENVLKIKNDVYSNLNWWKKIMFRVVYNL